MTFPFPQMPPSGGAYSQVFTDNAVDPSNASTHTFTSRAIGVAGNRYVVAAVFGSTASTTVSSMTIGGVSATYVIRTQNGANNVEIWIASVPTGTTATVVVNWGASQSRCGLGLWAIYNANATPFDTGGSTSASPMSDTMNIPATGGCIGVAANANGATYTWTNLTEDYDQTVEGANTQSGASATFVTAQTGLSISCTVTTSSDNVMALASWGPA